MLAKKLPKMKILMTFLKTCPPNLPNKASRTKYRKVRLAQTKKKNLKTTTS